MKLENRTIHGRVECLGSSRPQFEQQLNLQFGKDNWGYGWLVDIYVEDIGFVTTLLDKYQVAEHYFDAYAIYAQQFPWIFQALTDVALEVFEVDPEKDLESGTDFSLQVSERTHYMDIAIRRVLQMYGLQFKGTELINVNDGGTPLPEDLAYALPSQVATWFDLFNPSKLEVSQRIKPTQGLEHLELLTDPCSAEWAERPDTNSPLTAEALYQFTRVVWVKS